MELPPGGYRILTANRQINDSVLLRAETVRLSTNKTTERTVHPHESQVTSHLQHMPVGEYLLTVPDGRHVPFSALAIQTPATILAVLRPDAEPTEYLLSEMIELHDSYQGKDTILIILSPGVNNPILRHAPRTIPPIRLFTCGEREFEGRLYIDLQPGSRRLPLAAVLKKSMHARSAFSSYNVNTAGLLL